MNKNKHVGWNTHCISHVVWKRWEFLIVSSPALCSIQLDVAMSLQKDRSVLFITFIPLSPKYPSIVHSGSCFYPVSTPALSSGTGWAEHLWQHPLCSSYLSARESRWYSIPGACSAPGALPGSSGERRLGWCFYMSVEHWKYLWLVGWFFLSLVFTVFFFYGSIKQLPSLGSFDEVALERDPGCTSRVKCELEMESLNHDITALTAK